MQIGPAHLLPPSPTDWWETVSGLSVRRKLCVVQKSAVSLPLTTSPLITFDPFHPPPPWRQPLSLAVGVTSRSFRKHPERLFTKRFIITRSKDVTFNLGPFLICCLSVTFLIVQLLLGPGFSPEPSPILLNIWLVIRLWFTVTN